MRVEQHVVELGVVVRHAKRQAAAGERVHQRGGKRLVGQGLVNQVPHALRAARRVARHGLMQGREAVGRIVEALDRLMERAGVKALQH